MANMLFANNCNTTLNGGITAVATSMVVTSATGFPVPTGSQYFYCTLADAATQTTIEIVKVTAVSGTTFTIVRGQDGTTGTIFASGAVVSLRLVRASLNDFPKLDETNTFTADQAITGQLTTSAGLVTTSTFTATPPADGLVMDYATGFGRFSAFTGDGFQWFNGGVGTTKLMTLDSSGNLLLGTTTVAGKQTVYYTSTLPSLSSDTGAGITALGSSTLRVNIGSNPSAPYGGWLQTSNLGGTAFPFAINPLGGNVGIGVQSPATPLDVRSSSATVIAQFIGNSANNYIQISDNNGSNYVSYGSIAGGSGYIYTAGYVALYPGNSEKARFFASGGVSIGNTTDPGATNLSVTGTGNFGGSLTSTSLTVTNGASATNAAINGNAATILAVGRYSTDVNAPAINLRKQRGTIASPTIVASGDLTGDVFTQVYDGTNTINATLIRSQVDTVTGAGNINTNIQFLTRPTGGAAVVEAMRIFGSSGVSIGNTTDPGAGALRIKGSLVNEGAYSSTYHIDTTPSSITLATSGTVNISNFSGMVMVNNTATGGSQVWLCGGGATTSIGSNGAGGGGTLTYNAGIGGYTFTSTYVSTASFGFVIIRTRTTA